MDALCAPVGVLLCPDSKELETSQCAWRHVQNCGRARPAAPGLAPAALGSHGARSHLSVAFLPFTFTPDPHFPRPSPLYPPCQYIGRRPPGHTRDGAPLPRSVVGNRPTPSEGWRRAKAHTQSAACPARHPGGQERCPSHPPSRSVSGRRAAQGHTAATRWPWVLNSVWPDFRLPRLWPLCCAACRLNIEPLDPPPHAGCAGTRCRLPAAPPTARSCAGNVAGNVTAGLCLRQPLTSTITPICACSDTLIFGVPLRMLVFL